MRNWLLGTSALLVSLGFWLHQRPAREEKAQVLAVYGGFGLEPGRFNRPRTVTASRGIFYVLDITDRVQAFDLETGKFLRLWHLPDISRGRPQRILALPDGTLLVADTHYGRILRYDTEGNLLAQWGKEGNAPGDLHYPVGLLSMPDGSVAVSEYGGHDRVQVFSLAGVLQHSFGTCGPAPGAFQRPQNLALSPTGEGVLYVADAANQRIQAFTLEGRFLRCLAEGGLSYPYDVAVEADGNLLVLEYGAQRVSRWSPEGKPLGAWGGLAAPWAICLLEDGSVLVTNSDLHRVERWKLP